MGARLYIVMFERFKLQKEDWGCNGPFYTITYRLLLVTSANLLASVGVPKRQSVVILTAVRMFDWLK